MKKHGLLKITLLITIIMLGSCAGTIVAPPGLSSKLTDISINDTDSATTITMKTNNLPQYASFKAKSPPSITLDLASTDASGVSRKVSVDNGFVKKILTDQLGASTGYSSRIVVTLDKPLSYSVSSDGNNIVLTISKTEQQTPALLSPEGLQQTTTAQLTGGTEITVSAAPEMLAPEGMGASPTTGPEALAPLGAGMEATEPTTQEMLAPEGMGASPTTGPEELAPLGAGMEATAPTAPEMLAPEGMGASPTTGPEALAPLGAGMEATAPVVPEILAPEAIETSPTTGPEALAPLGAGTEGGTPAVPPAPAGSEQPLVTAAVPISPSVSPSVPEQQASTDNMQTTTINTAPPVPAPAAPAPPPAPPVVNQQTENQQVAMVTPAPAVPSPAEAIKIRRGTIITSVPLIFKSNEAVLSAHAEESLKDVADYMAEHKNARLIIEGYSDANGHEAYNKELSFYRITWVKLTLERYGVSAKRLILKPMGKTTKFGHNKSTYAQNRRVVLKIAK